MARPTVPLISRRNALAVALRIIDEEGLDALSIRRLGEELKVNGASLYHHFSGKDEILVGVAQLALADVRAPDTDLDWRTWLPANARGLRDALLAHPNLLPVLLHRDRMGIGADQLDASARILEDQGVSTHLVLPMIETLEVFAIATALREVNATTERAMETADMLHPALQRAFAARATVTDEVFDQVCLAVIGALEQYLPVRKRRPATPRKRTASG